MKKVAIIGLGQLGSRHLQALAAADGPFDIELVDVSPASLDLAVSRFYEMPAANSFKGKITRHNSVNELSNELHIVIVACNSMERRALTESLLTNKSVNYLILEKVLFPAIEDYITIGELIKRKEVKTWVNCSRRMMPSYQKIKDLITPGAKIDFSVSGAKWGLGSNGIHFIDLFCFLTNDYSLKLSADLLDDTNPIESNRKGYIDFTGAYTGITGSKHFFKMASLKDGTSPLQVKIDTPYERITVNESLGKVIYSCEKNGWRSEDLDFEILYQSRLTTILVNDLFKEGTCGLPTYSEARLNHVMFLASLIDYEKNKTGLEPAVCRIT